MEKEYYFWNSHRDYNIWKARSVCFSVSLVFIHLYKKFSGVFRFIDALPPVICFSTSTIEIMVLSL